jgi:hypothetical protein
LPFAGRFPQDGEHYLPRRRHAADHQQANHGNTSNEAREFAAQWLREWTGSNPRKLASFYTDSGDVAGVSRQVARYSVMINNLLSASS